MFQYLSETNIPDYYKDITGLECKYCKSPVIVNDNRTIVKCSNPYCVRKIAGEIDLITTNAQIKEVGPAVSLQYVNDYGYKKITDFLLNPPVDLKDCIEDLKSNVTDLQEAIVLLQLPGFKEKATRMFKPYSTMEEAFTAIDSHKEYIWGFIGDSLGYKDEYLNALENYFNYLPDLYNVDKVFTNLQKKAIAVRENLTVNVCISGKLNSSIIENMYGRQLQKKLFIEALNNIFSKENIFFNWQESLTRDTDFLVSEPGNNTSKSRRAKEMGVLTTSDDLINLFIQVVEEAKNHG